MDRSLRKYYYAATLNLFLWGPVAISVLLPESFEGEFEQNVIRGLVAAGMLLAAILQHWTYYDVYNPKTRLSASSLKSQDA